MVYVFRKLVANESFCYVETRILTNQSWFYKQKAANHSLCEVHIPLVDQSKLMLDLFLFRSLSGLSKQSKLSWLSLAGNQLSSLDAGILEKLPLLRYLSVENNEISHLRGLQVPVFIILFHFPRILIKAIFTCSKSLSLLSEFSKPPGALYR